MEYIRTTKVIKTGSSLCIVIPKAILHALKIERGDQVVFGILDTYTIAVHKISPEEFFKFNPASAGATAKP